ncbi:predicted protein [Chaetoceros tenuissimus]|uniref:Uncharacterized protein n=1 Tax=Chaetoceros tenuissimus TaxID=426638 RepID=A0AAD3DAX1_9STRA|nr:predicted protein [Chaetoceros tenuissimus]
MTTDKKKEEEVLLKGNPQENPMQNEKDIESQTKEDLADVVLFNRAAARNFLSSIFRTLMSVCFVCGATYLLSEVETFDKITDKQSLDDDRVGGFFIFGLLLFSLATIFDAIKDKNFGCTYLTSHCLALIGIFFWFVGSLFFFPEVYEREEPTTGHALWVGGSLFLIVAELVMFQALRVTKAGLMSFTSLFFGFVGTFLFLSGAFLMFEQEDQVAGANCYVAGAVFYLVHGICSMIAVAFEPVPTATEINQSPGQLGILSEASRSFFSCIFRIIMGVCFLCASSYFHSDKKHYETEDIMNSGTLPEKLLDPMPENNRTAAFFLFGLILLFLATFIDAIKDHKFSCKHASSHYVAMVGVIFWFVGDLFLFPKVLKEDEPDTGHALWIFGAAVLIISEIMLVMSYLTRDRKASTTTFASIGFGLLGALMFLTAGSLMLATFPTLENETEAVKGCLNLTGVNSVLEDACKPLVEDTIKKLVSQTDQYGRGIDCYVAGSVFYLLHGIFSLVALAFQ